MFSSIVNYQSYYGWRGEGGGDAQLGTLERIYGRVFQTEKEPT
jgi:hypothetical protein